MTDMMITTKKTLMVNRMVTCSVGEATRWGSRSAIMWFSQNPQSGQDQQRESYR
jgi:hypothetical protein